MLLLFSVVMGIVLLSLMLSVMLSSLKLLSFLIDTLHLNNELNIRYRRIHSLTRWSHTFIRLCLFVCLFVIYHKRLSWMRNVGFSNVSHDRPESFKQVLTTQLLKARQQVSVSLVLGDQPFIGNGDVSISVKILGWDVKNQTKRFCYVFVREPVYYMNCIDIVLNTLINSLSFLIFRGLTMISFTTCKVPFQVKLNPLALYLSSDTNDIVMLFPVAVILNGLNSPRSHRLSSVKQQGSTSSIFRQKYV